MMPALLLTVVVALQDPAMSARPDAAAGPLEGRPPAAETSPLQARVDAAAPGSVLEIGPGDYVGDLYIDRPLRLVGRDRPRLIGSGRGSVVRVRADDVTIEGFEIDGRLGGSLARDSSGVHIAGRRVTVRDCRISRALFGVYLYAADHARVERVIVDGIRGKAAGEQGSGIHIWNTTGFEILDSAIRYSRDGVYLQSSTHGVVSRTHVHDVRYGLHYMYSDDNLFEENVFERSAAGAALMYSRRLIFRRNRFVHNRGFASVGLLLNGCEDVTATDNVIADNARGVFLEGSRRNRFRGNVIAGSDIAVVLYDSTEDTRFEGNTFSGNLSPLQLVGRRTSTVFDGNFWSEADEPDLDGDGVRDRPYRLSNVFDHLRGNLAAADLFAQGLGAAVLASAERAFPVIDPVAVVDARPLARAPRSEGVPPLPAAAGRATAAGLAGSAMTLTAGLAVLWSGRRRHATTSRR